MILPFYFRSEKILMQAPSVTSTEKVLNSAREFSAILAVIPAFRFQLKNEEEI